MPLQPFKTNMVKKRCVILNVENFKKYIALWDSVFPFGCEVHSNTGSLFFRFCIKG